MRWKAWKLMKRKPWSGTRGSGYPSAMEDRPRRADELEPVRRSPELDQYRGQWVATKGGHVVAHASSSSDLVKMVRALGETGKDVVAEFVAPPSNSWTVGVG